MHRTSLLTLRVKKTNSTPLAAPWAESPKPCRANKEYNFHVTIHLSVTSVGLLPRKPNFPKIYKSLSNKPNFPKLYKSSQKFYSHLSKVNLCCCILRLYHKFLQLKYFHWSLQQQTSAKFKNITIRMLIIVFKASAMKIQQHDYWTHKNFTEKNCWPKAPPKVLDNYERWLLTFSLRTVCLSYDPLKIGCSQLFTWHLVVW